MERFRPITVSAAWALFGIGISVGHMVGCAPTVHIPAVPSVTPAPDRADPGPAPWAEALGDDRGLGAFGAFLDLSFSGDETATVEMICPEVVAVPRPPGDLPEPLRVAFETEVPGATAGFAFEPDLTRLVGRRLELASERWPEEAAVPVQSWVFRHPGGVVEALEVLEALEAPDDAEWLPWGTSVGPMLQGYLHAWGTELRAARGAEWSALAETRVSDWWDVHQTGAEARYALEDRTAVYAVCGAEDDGPAHVGVFAWSMNAFSPFIDWSTLTLTEGTYVVVLRFDYSYSF